MAAIHVDHLGKRYRIGQIQRYKALRDTLADAIRAPFRSRSARSDAFIWALKDVFFEVQPGEAVGIVGRNGAGKSTLLKILSRITEPTEGEARIRGRVGSLLEVGTGFHPELTGRENIYLNGAILGMKRQEIGRKLDQIVAFAEVEKFVDTPVKFYSSGMYVRLAFAVAAHSEPEVLLVDEVLSVGDAAFQKKCMGRMGEVAQEGRTVLFVSHNMGAMNRLCSRGILLDGGLLIEDGPIEAVTRKYVERALPSDGAGSVRFAERPGLTFQILGVAFTDESGVPQSSIGIWQQALVHLDVAVRRELFGSNLALCISRDGSYVYQTFDTDLSPELFERRGPGLYRAAVRLPAGLLGPGRYTVTAAAGFMTSVGGVDNQRDVIAFDVVADGEDIEHKSYSRNAAVIARLPWRIERVRDL